MLHEKGPREMVMTMTKYGAFSARGANVDFTDRFLSAAIASAIDGTKWRMRRSRTHG
jgi:hypothetical protein